MEIKIIGSNSSNRTKLLKNLGKAIEQLKGHYGTSILEDKKYLEKYGISNTPGFVIDNKVISQGKVLTDKEIKNYIKLLG